MSNGESNKYEKTYYVDPEYSAGVAGLKYVSDNKPGYRRKKSGRGFIYVNPKGEKVTDPALIERFKALVIPPAWREVWICPDKKGHMQVTGRDQKGRKQYIYHPLWDEIRNSTKFYRLIDFAEILPHIRETVDKHLSKRGRTKEQVMAIIIQLLEKTLIRIGNIEYAKMNNSYGITTLRNKHVDINGSKIKFVFKGKSGKQWTVTLNDRRLARLVKQCQELPGQEVFNYIDEEGKLNTIDSSEVNEYIRGITGQDFSAKDFRTWSGTVIAALTLYELGPPEDEKDEKKKIIKTVKTVSDELINTPSICRKYYIHPDIFTSFNDGTLFSVMGKTLKEETKPNGLDPEEKAVLKILKKKAE
jgi:DNA topoisomerase I